MAATDVSGALQIDARRWWRTESDGPPDTVWAAALDDARAAAHSDAVGAIGFKAQVDERADTAAQAWNSVTDVDEPAAGWLH